MTAPRQPGERPAYRALLPAPLLTAALAALAVAGAVARAPDEVRVPLALGGACAALLLCAAVAMAARGIHSTRLLREQLAGVIDDAGRLLHDRSRLTEELNQVRAASPPTWNGNARACPPISPANAPASPRPPPRS